MTYQQHSLTDAEYSEGAVERNPAHARDLEAAAVEDDGTLIAWNQKGDPVEIGMKDRDAVVSLLLKGRIEKRHVNTLLRVIEGHSRGEMQDDLLSLFEELVKTQPPAGFEGINERVKIIRAAATPLADRRSSPAALLWTVNRSLNLTSCTGPGAAYLRASDLPKIYGQASLYNFLNIPVTGDDAHPVISAHTRALMGHSSSVDVERDGGVWHAHLEPVRDRAGEVVGVAGYAYSVTDQVAREVEVEGMAIVTAHAVFTYANQAYRRLWDFPADADLYNPVDARNLMLARVADPAAFVERLDEIYAGKVPTQDYVELKDGRTLYRYLTPILDARGTVRARMVYLRDVTEERKVLLHPEEDRRTA